MKRGQEFYIFLFFCLNLLLIPGCKIVKPPTLTTVEVSDIGPTSAISGGNITNDGHAEILVRGVCWSTTKSPTNEDPRTTDGYGLGTYSSMITDLEPNTLYYLRAYATNSEGTSYGNQLTFTTVEYSVPSVTTTAITGITQTTAITGGDIINDGGKEVTARGVCWSTHTTPTLSDSKTANGTGAGSFVSNISGLTGNTTYYVRAYATNDEGTAYGQEVSFKTSPLLPVVTTAVPYATSTITGAGGGNVTSDGGSPVTARGVCWSTTANPTITNSRSNDGAGTGSFTSEITGLSANTTYHVRAYATNSVGTAYGNDRTFTTDPVTVIDSDDNIYDVIRVGTQVWMDENLKTTTFNDDDAIALVGGSSAWSNLTSPGYCWYANDEDNKDIYGALYNWHAVNSGKLCPSGWRVPADDDWTILENYLGGQSPAGGKLKETGTIHWASPNTGATNEYDFTARPGGWRTNTGTFQYINNNGYWWSSTLITPDSFYRHIHYDSDKVFRNLINGKYGMSVRCIKE